MSRAGLLRWLKFNAVGAAGVVVQVSVLSSLIWLGGVHYLVATVVAVEAAILHNFVWHWRWTWSDRCLSSPAAALMKFNLTTGAMSLMGNVALMWLFVGSAGLSPHLGNLATIGTCSLVNYFMSDRFVFRW